MIKVLVEERQVTIKALADVRVINTTCREASENVLQRILNEYKQSDLNVKLTVYNRVKNYKRIYNFPRGVKLPLNNQNSSNKNLKFKPKEMIALQKSKKALTDDKVALQFRAFTRAVKRGSTDEAYAYLDNINKLTE